MTTMVHKPTYNWGTASCNSQASVLIELEDLIAVSFIMLQAAILRQ